MKEENINCMMFVSVFRESQEMKESLDPQDERSHEFFLQDKDTEAQRQNGLPLDLLIKVDFFF